MDGFKPAPGWEALWSAHQRLLNDLTEAYREVMAHADPVKRKLLAKRFEAECAPIIRAMTQIPMVG